MIYQLSQITESPFIKVEATQFTEVGYYGKDVDTIIHDLVNKSVTDHKQKFYKQYKNMSDEIDELINLVILDILIGEDYNNTKDREIKLMLLQKGFFDDVTVSISKDFIQKYIFTKEEYDNIN